MDSKADKYKTVDIKLHHTSYAQSRFNLQR